MKQIAVSSGSKQRIITQSTFLNRITKNNMSKTHDKTMFCLVVYGYIIA